FLWPKEVKLFHHILKLDNHTLAFLDEEKGTLWENDFLPHIFFYACVPLILDSFLESFVGCQSYVVFDVFWGFDMHKVYPMSKDLTAFLTPLRLLCITPIIRYTKLLAEFQNCMAFILKKKILRTANVFIDNLPIKGP
ncbi:hypothetical protein CERSUDRAFT_59490, partial [Gelatoporia subvermispora B]